MNDDLPQGWASAVLNDIAEIGPRHPKGLDDDMLVTFVPMAAISEAKPEFQHTEERPLGDVRKGFTHFAERDVLFAKITPCMENGKGAVARGLRNKLGCGTTELHVIRPLADISPDYIYRFLAQRSVRRMAKENFTGTAGQARVPTSFIEELEIPLAPLAEQQRIVAKLEKLLGQVDACQQRLTRIPALLKRFRQSVVGAACSGRLTVDWREDDTYEDDLPTSWCWMPLEELLPRGGIFDGPFGSNLKSSDYTKSGVRVIRLENIGQLRFIGEKETFVSREKYEKLEKHAVGEGDIIFASFISEEVRACVLPKLSTKAIAKADCFCLRPDAKLMNNKFLAFQLVCQESYDTLFEEIHGATRPRINTTQLRKLEVRVCPLPEQQEIVRRVEGLFALADRIEARFAEGRKRVNSITQAILAKAFRGDLVPTEFELAKAEGRSFESAEELLRRIRQNDDAKQKPQKLARMPKTAEAPPRKNRHLQKALRGKF